MRLTSSAFSHGGTIPPRHATVNVPGGEGLSIPLSWDGVPEGTRSFVIALIDHHPVAKEWEHWLVTDIPGDVDAIEEGASRTAMPRGAVEHANTGGKAGYGGPQPPVGTGPHEYETTVFALDLPSLGLSPAADWAAIRDAMGGHVLASASVMGVFER